MIRAIVIISLCRNPDGLLWAGDTAQTISIGSTFTFKKLSASVNRYQVCESMVLPNSVWRISLQRSIGALRGTPRLPERFQLLTNYRSHGGIVECANAIIQLLQRFPGAIDRLQPEAGVVGKELPKFFHGKGLPQIREFFLSTPCGLHIFSNARESQLTLICSGRLAKLGHNQCMQDLFSLLGHQ